VTVGGAACAGPQRHAAAPAIKPTIMNLVARSIFIPETTVAIPFIVAAIGSDFKAAL